LGPSRHAGGRDVSRAKQCAEQGSEKERGNGRTDDTNAAMRATDRWTFYGSSGIQKERQGDKQAAAKATIDDRVEFKKTT